MSDTLMTMTVRADLSKRDKDDLGRVLFNALVPFLDPRDEKSSATISWQSAA